MSKSPFHNHLRKIVILPLVLACTFILLMVACAAQPEITTTPVPTSQPLVSPPVPIESSPPTTSPIPSATASPLPSPEWVATITPQAEAGEIVSLTYSPDGRWLAVGTSLGVHLYDAHTLVPQRFIATGARVAHLVFTPDGQTLATHSTGVSVWRVTDGALLYTIDEYVSVLEFSPDSSILATSGNTGNVKLWRTSDGTLLHELDKYISAYDLHFSPDGRSLATVGSTLHLWSVPEGTLMREFPARCDMLMGCDKVFFAQNGQMLITFNGSMITGWDVGDGNERFSQVVDVYADGLAVSLEGKHLATSNMALSLYQVADGAFVQKLQDFSSSQGALAFAPNGNFLAAPDGSSLKIWDVSQGTLLQSLSGIHAGPFVFSPDSAFLAVGDHLSGEVQVWQIEDGTLLARLDGRGRVLPALAVSPSIVESTPLAPDQHWATSFRMAGLDGTVQTLASDLNGNLYAGGDFITVDGLWVNHIARWDGTIWQPLGGGLGYVDALATDNQGNVYATTMLDGARRIARWDGSVWSLLPGVFDNYIDNLATDSQGNIYVAGWFTAVDNLVVHHIARWDGASWSALGDGLEYMATDIVVSPQGHLYVSSGFADAGRNSAYHVYEWDGKVWATLGGTFDSIIYALALDDAGTIYAGGLFMTADGVSANHIAQWDGTTWLPMGTGLGENQWKNVEDCVETLAIDPQGHLLAGGYINTIQGARTNYLARWDGQTWSKLGGGTNDAILSIHVTKQGMVAVGGKFSTAGDTPTAFLASWEETAWKTVASSQTIGVGLNGNVSAIVLDNQDQLYVAGEFQQAGQIPVNYIARWDGQIWKELGSGLNGPVSSLALDSRGNLYASGDFTSAGGRAANHIARWNGTSWSALGKGFEGTTQLAIGQNDILYAYWRGAGGTVFHVARWNGIAWDSFKTSSRELCDTFGCEMIVDRQGKLYTGNFEAPVARWDGAKWVTLGDKIFPGKFYVDAQDTLYVSGQRSGLTDGLFKWDGAAWQEIGNFPSVSNESGPEDFGTITAILAGSEPGTLYVIGSRPIKYVGDAQSLYFWDGSSWKKLADLGINQGVVSELALDSQGNIYLAGEFTAVGNVPSSHLALWLAK